MEDLTEELTEQEPHELSRGARDAPCRGANQVMATIKAGSIRPLILTSIRFF